MKIVANTQQFDSATQSGRLVIADFYADWCGPCKAQGPILDELSEELAGKVDIIKINVDEQPELAARFGVMSIPTLVFFQNKELVGTAVGLQRKQALLTKVAMLQATN